MSRVDPKTLSLDDLRFLVRYHDRAPPVSTYAPCAAECGRGETP